MLSVTLGLKKKITSFGQPTSLFRFLMKDCNLFTCQGRFARGVTPAGGKPLENLRKTFGKHDCTVAGLWLLDY